MAVTDPQGHTSTSVYDKDNRLLSSTDFDGRKKVFAYDGDGRLLTETWYNADGSLADTLRYTYDQDGNLLTASNAQGSYSFSYDSAGQMLSQTDPFNLTLSFGYDGDGNVTSVQDSLGGQVQSSYDSDGRLVSRQLAGNGQAPVGLTLAYNPRGQVATLTRTLAGQKLGQSVYTYDQAGNLTHLQHQNAAGQVLADYGYTYDSSNQLTSENDNGTVTGYGYDGAGQLTRAGSQGMSYDANGNRTTAGYQTGSANELASDGTWHYTYDNEGNVTGKTNISTKETWTYTYDLNNNMISAVHKSATGTLLGQVTMKYDVFGHRVEEDTLDPTTGLTTVQRFAYDQEGNAWADLDGNNVLQDRRLYADINGQEQPFVRLTAGGVAAWYLTDHLGSVRDLVDDSGVVLDHVDYDAWGNITNETHAAAGDRFKYTGGEWQATLGLYGFGARWYAPDTGRWYSQDPSAFEGGDSNLYRYVHNDPTTLTDPTGLRPFRFRPSLPFQVTKHWTLQDLLDRLQTRYGAQIRPGLIAELKKLFDIAKKTKKPPAPNACAKWVENVIKQLPLFKQIKIDSGQWEYDLIGVPGTGHRLGHMAIKVTLPDDTVFYLDNGWWGNAEGLFGPSDVPRGVTPYVPGKK